MTTKIESTRTLVQTKFRARLLRWYDTNARDLPWRLTRDPYRVWVSEIMLQQTRVNAVLEHYRRFLELFPDVETLSAAPLNSVLAAWSGLGYYRRARMLHQAARDIVRERDGNFPATSADWRALPGIGRYTAAAIASIAFHEPIAVVDGNVERVLDRFFARTLSPNEVWLKAQGLLARNRPGDFNQAMMELGATICTPRSPQCLVCPVVDLCASRGERPAQKKTAKQHKREIYYALNQRSGCIQLVERSLTGSLMPGMWELPELSNGSDGTPPLLTLRHSITVTDYVVRVAQKRVRHGEWVKINDLNQIPLTGLTRKILKVAGVLKPEARSPEPEA